MCALYKGFAGSSNDNGAESGESDAGEPYHHPGIDAGEPYHHPGSRHTEDRRSAIQKLLKYLRIVLQDPSSVQRTWRQNTRLAIQQAAYPFCLQGWVGRFGFR